jgi:hypothetical protein
VFQDVREGSLEPQPQIFVDRHCFGQSCAYGNRSGAFENADPGITDASCSHWRRRKGIDVEIVGCGAVSRNRIAYEIRTQDRPDNSGSVLVWSFVSGMPFSDGHRPLEFSATWHPEGLIVGVS